MASSNDSAPVSMRARPNMVPPPSAVPLTRSKVSGPSTLMMLTPLPMLTMRNGYDGNSTGTVFTSSPNFTRVQV